MTSFQTTYDEQKDEELCALAATGDRTAEEFLITRYIRMVRTLSRPLFLMGGDSEDLIQEGMLGLLKAVRDYSPDRGASFRTFAHICVRNSMISAVKTASEIITPTDVKQLIFFSFNDNRLFWAIPFESTSLLLKKPLSRLER